MDEIERDLTTTLSRRADSVRPPHVDPQALLESGRGAVRRLRRRTAVYSVAAIVVVALIATGAGVLGSRATDTGPVNTPSSTHRSSSSVRPLTVEDLPRGAASALPYWLRGSLHIGDAKITMSHPDIISSDGVTIVSRVKASALRVIFLVRGQHLELLTDHALTDPVMSAGGQFAAWETAGSGHLTDLVAWDLASGREIGTRAFHSQAHCCDAPSYPVGIDAHTQVYVWDGGHAIVWNWQDGTVLPINGIAGDGLADAYAEGPVFEQSGDYRAWSIYGLIHPGERVADVFGRVGRFPAQGGSWSPTRGTDEFVAFVPVRGQAPVVLDAEKFQRTRLRLPEGIYVNGAWEDQTHVLVSSAANGNTYLLRCDATDGDCEIAQRFDGVGPASLQLPADG